MRRAVRILLQAGLTVCALVAWAGAAGAATLTVNTTSDTSTPNDGMCSLREAIDVTSDAPFHNDCGATDAVGNTIVLPASGFPYALTLPIPAGDSNAGGDLDVTGSVPLVIQGAGAGQTTIDASGLSDRVLHVFGGAAVTVAGVTITGGRAPDGAAGLNADIPPALNNASTAGSRGEDGGAIANEGTLTLSEVVFTANRAGDGGKGGNGSGAHPAPSRGGAGGAGGAIFSDGRLTVEQATFIANHAGAGGEGGAGQPGAEGSTVSGAGAGAGGAGGAIANSGGDLTVRRSLFTQNAAGDGGQGGLGGDNSVTGDVPSSGGRGGDGGSGGAIGAVAGNTAVQNSTLVNNSGGTGGAGGPAGDDESGNNPTHGADGGNEGSGGAIFLGGGNVLIKGSDENTVDSVTVTADRSGAPGAAGSTTRTPGHAGSASGAGGIVANSPYSVTLTNTLLSQNSSGNCGGGVRGDAGDLSFGDGTCPGTFRGGNPRLDGLGDNGGPTHTVALGTGSAALNAGTSCPATDQRGVARPAGTGCDIGAFERAAPTAAASAADGLSATGATLHGSVNPNDATAGAHFEYGTTVAYGQSTASQTLNGVGVQTLSPASITGLTPGTRYHFRLVATSTDGTTRTSDATFTTNAAPGGTGGGGSGGSPKGNGAPPALAHLTVNPAILARRGHHHVTISYDDSAAAQTTIVLLRRATGMRRGRRCVAAGRRRATHRCTRLVRIGSLSHTDRTGRNRLLLTNRLKRASLPAGTYVLELTPRLGTRMGRTRTLVLRVA